MGKMRTTAAGGMDGVVGHVESLALLLSSAFSFELLVWRRRTKTESESGASKRFGGEMKRNLSV